MDGIGGTAPYQLQLGIQLVHGPDTNHAACGELGQYHGAWGVGKEGEGESGGASEAIATHPRGPHPKHVDTMSA
jgi:hypothetical protein